MNYMVKHLQATTSLAAQPIRQDGQRGQFVAATVNHQAASAGGCVTV